MPWQISWNLLKRLLRNPSELQLSVLQVYTHWWVQCLGKVFYQIWMAMLGNDQHACVWVFRSLQLRLNPSKESSEKNHLLALILVRPNENSERHSWPTYVRNTQNPIHCKRYQERRSCNSKAASHSRFRGSFKVRNAQRGEHPSWKFRWDHECTWSCTVETDRKCEALCT